MQGPSTLQSAWLAQLDDWRTLISVEVTCQIMAEHASLGLGQQREKHKALKKSAF